MENAGILRLKNGLQFRVSHSQALRATGIFGDSDFSEAEAAEILELLGLKIREREKLIMILRLISLEEWGNKYTAVLRDEIRVLKGEGSALHQDSSFYEGIMCNQENKEKFIDDYFKDIRKKISDENWTDFVRVNYFHPFMPDALRVLRESEKPEPTEGDLIPDRLFSQLAEQRGD